jgi:hypothetical protein
MALQRADSELAAANLALGHCHEEEIGAPDLSDDLARARSVRRHFGTARDALFRRPINWGFATAWVTLTADPVASPSFLTKRYPLPADCIRVRLVQDVAGANGVQLQEAEWSLESGAVGSSGASGEGTFLVCNIDHPVVCYTRRIETVALWDALFLSAFTHLLAAAIAPEIGRSGELAKEQRAEAEALLAPAEKAAGDEMRAGRARRYAAQVRDALLRRLNWSFATGWSQPALDATPSPGFLSKRYPLPADCLAVRFVQDAPGATGKQLLPEEWAVEGGTTSGGAAALFLVTSRDNPVVCYTRRVTDTAQWDPLFRDAYDHLLLASSAPDSEDGKAEALRQRELAEKILVPLAEKQNAEENRAQRQQYHFARVRDALLRRLNWTFATGWSQPPLDASASPGFLTRRYRLPSDYLAMRFVQDAAGADGAQLMPEEWTVEGGTAFDGSETLFLVTNEINPVVCYTRRVSDMAQWDPLFRDAFDHMLAAATAPDSEEGKAQALRERELAEKILVPLAEKQNAEETRAALRQRYFARVRDALLRRVNWNFATGWSQPPLADDTSPNRLALRYLLPADCLAVRFVQDAPGENAAELDADQWAVESAVYTGAPRMFLVTNETDPVVCYTKRITDMAQWDPLFRDAFDHMLAAAAAPDTPEGRAEAKRERVFAEELLVPLAETRDHKEKARSQQPRRIFSWGMARGGGYPGNYLDRRRW